MKTLVIAEKPSVGRDIARVLGCRKQADGALEGDKYIVTWGLGHLVELADPESYDPKYKEWKMEDLPMMPEPFKLEVIGQTAKQFKVVRNQIHRKDVREIVIATDAGREGELVARLILKKAGTDKPLKRLWISSVTDKAIREGFAHLRDGKEYEPLYDAAMCRAEADWLVGINATRALTCKYNAQLSCGRVQTPTLAIIAKREKEIREFVPKPYYGLTAYGTPGVTLTWRDEKSGSYRSFDKNRITALEKALRGKDGVVTEVKRTAKKTPAPLLYDLTELQREANRRFHYSAKETLNIMQRLYENHKVLTYPRTDSRYLSSDIVPTLKERLRACGTGPYRKLAGKLLNQTFTAKASFVNDAKVSDHHAIIPTEQFVSLEHMTIDERRIYDLVVRRFLAVLYPPFEYEQVSLTVDIGGEIFAAGGKTVKSAGWKEVYEADGDDWEDEETGRDLEAGKAVREQKLPSIAKGDRFTGLHFTVTEGKTKPPAPFTEATLLSAMENPVAYMESGDRAMAKTLGETGGLGTVATRADIIEKLFKSFLLEKRGEDIFLTSKAKQLLELVPEDLRKPELTADWEMRLSKIAKGNLKRAAFMKDIRGYTVDLISQIKQGEGTFRHDNLTNKRCPRCGKRLLAVKGKNSEMLVCQDRECGYRETVSRTSNARCPKCHKKMELRGKGDGQIFVCRCGYKEKLSSFQERRKKEGAGVSKRDVARYLNQQKKEAEAPLNNAFAEALAKLKQ
ncbi:MAG TPA: DNA topoisomerase III [Candidatus Lachnoclostridium stercorigallinarum]|uniref:DNA topoisomerase 3 n=1 Tax=Candidatus Lachnoclostridium stercorigallinarum TaxID=2838634 RepID=A0A9D2GJ92_9FIRM|nr:DNA topoisomerase III [Candidatus Lachnoclostridium stercorigallinarum]